MSVVVSYRRQAVVFAVMAAIALVATEAAVRMLEETVIPKCTFLSHDLYRDVPIEVKEDMCREYWSSLSDYDGKTYVPRPFDGRHISIDEGGFRGAGPGTIDNGSYRIFMLGGSTTIGLVTVSDDLTIPALLEKKLRDSGLDARVVNAGVTAASTHDERYRVERYEEWDPDMVIMYDGVNEITYQGATYEEFLDVEHWYNVGGAGGLRVPLPAGYGGLVDTDNWGMLDNSTLSDGRHDLPPLPGDLPPPSQPANASGDEAGDTKAGRQWGPGIGIERLAIWLDYRTALGAIEWLREHTAPRRDHASWEDNVLMGDPSHVIERSLHANWAAVCELGESRGFTTVNFLQPHLGTADRAISEHEVDSYYAPQLIKTDPPTYVRASQLLANVTLDPAGYHPCGNVHDLRGVFDGMGGATIYFDWHHMRGGGNDVVASAMYDIVRPLVADGLAQPLKEARG